MRRAGPGAASAMRETMLSDTVAYLAMQSVGWPLVTYRTSRDALAPVEVEDAFAATSPSSS